MIIFWSSIYIVGMFILPHIFWVLISERRIHEWILCSQHCFLFHYCKICPWLFFGYVWCMYDFKVKTSTGSPYWLNMCSCLTSLENLHGKSHWFWLILSLPCKTGYFFSAFNLEHWLWITMCFRDFVTQISGEKLLELAQKNIVEMELISDTCQ